MPVGRKFSMHRGVLAKLKLRQLDVYRYKDRDVLRVMTSSGKVLLIQLNRHREEYTSPEDFEKAVKEAIEKTEKKGEKKEGEGKEK